MVLRSEFQAFYLVIYMPVSRHKRMISIYHGAPMRLHRNATKLRVTVENVGPITATLH